MSQDIDRIVNMYNRNYLEAKDSNGQQVMNIISKIKDPLTKIKMLQALAPTMFALSGGHPILNKISAVAMGSTAITGDSYLKRLDQQAQLKAVNRLEKQVGYSNASGDTAFRAITGINNIGMSVGVTGAIAKGLGQAGVIPNVLQHVNPLVLMGAMQGGKGVGTMSAGAFGGLGGLGSALGSIGAHGATATSAASAGLLSALNPTMLGVMAMMAMNMSGSKITDMMKNAGSTNTRKFRASVNLHMTAGTQLELEYSNMVQISSQIKMMTNMNLLTPAETLQANILMMIESHTSVLAPMLAEMKNETEKKQKLGANAGQNVASDFFSEDGLLALQNQKGTRKNPNFIQRGAKHFAQFATNLSSVVDIFGQIGNTLSGKSSSQLFNESNRQSHTIDANQKFSDKYGIAVSMVSTIHTSAAEVLSKADTFEAKQISILAGIYELNRYQGHELLSIRRDGLGVERPGHTGDLAKMRIEEEADEGEIETFGKMLDEMMGYIPLWHTISGSAKMVMAGYENMQELILGSKNANGIRTRNNPFTSMLREMGDVFTKSFTQTITDEGSLRDTIGATKLAPSELMARYLSGDYIKQMTDLVNYNRESAHYLKYLAERESARSSGIHRLSDYQSEEALQMDEFSGKLLNKKQMRKRDNAIGKKLRAAIRGVAPDGFLGNLMSVLGLASADKAEDYNIRKFNHVNELHAQFGNTGGYRGRPSYATGTGDTGKAAPGTKPDASGKKPIDATIHEGESIIPDINKKPSWLKRIVNWSLPASSPKVTLTSEDKAKTIQAEEVQANEARNNIKQTELQTGMEKTLKSIKETNEIIAANTKKEKPKSDGFGLGGLLGGILKFGDWLFKGLTSGFGVIGLLRAMPAAIMALIKATPTVLSKILNGGKNLFAKSAAFAGRMGIPGFENQENKLTPKLIEGASERLVPDLIEGASSPLNPKDKISFMEKAKNWLSGKAGSATDKLKTTGSAVAKDLGGLKGLAGKSAWLAAFYAGADYFLQSDTNQDGTQKTVTDKLKQVGSDLAGSAGGILGGVIGGSIGSVLLPVGGTIIGGIVGSIIGQMAQDKVKEWWTNFTTSANGKKMGVAESVGYFWGGLSEDAKTGAKIGAGIGSLIMPVFGTLLGGYIGSQISDDVVIKVKEVKKWFGDVSDSAMTGLSKLEDDFKKLPGVETGMTIGRKLFGDNWFGSLLGGLVGGSIGGLDYLGQKALKIIGHPIDAAQAGYTWVKDAAGKVYQATKDAAGNLVDATGKMITGAVSEIKPDYERGEAAGAQQVASNITKLKIATGQTYSVDSGKRYADKQIELFRSNKAGAVAVATDHYSGDAQDVSGNLLEYLKTNYLLNPRYGNRANRFKELNKFLAKYNLRTYDEGGTNGTDNIHLENINGMSEEGKKAIHNESANFINSASVNADSWLEQIKSQPKWAAKRKLTGITDRATLLTTLTDRANVNLKKFGAEEVVLDAGIVSKAKEIAADTSNGQAAIDLAKKAQAELAKKQTKIETNAKEEMISKKESDQKLGTISSQLASANAHLANMSAKQSALVEAADKASTLWKYIEEVYSTPKFNDAQFSAITIR